MKYISTRGKSTPVSFQEAVLSGLARDGGLFIPENVPDFSSKLEELKTLSYTELALEIFSPYVAGELDRETLKRLIEQSYQSFKHKDIVPLSCHSDYTILELFHGPTLAFKDVALQFLGNLFEELLKKTGNPLTILGATSGDTGSAAIHGVRGKKGISIFMLHPKGKVSPIQEKQMTTILDENVHNIAIEGSFDDAQQIVKETFNDLSFRDENHLGAVNSINWARIMAQIVYYFYAAFRFEEKYPGKPLYFSVPTGNFGDIYAGYVAQKMGLPIHKFVLATNENNILARTLETGNYRIEGVYTTISPSMDIQISSNFERFLFDLVGKDGNAVQELMDSLKEKGEFTLSAERLSKAQSYFAGISIDTEQTLATIRKADQEGVSLDPHTAVGVAAAESFTQEKVICLATAHPAKFKDAVVRATGKEPEIPSSLEGIMEKPTRCLESNAEAKQIQSIIRERI